ncbi:MAG: protein translocase subunit SecD [Gammaproteobacteria bacterium]|jgi:preprotein translocase subunit SecD|nr:protein translocase subunit SecD [Gammaproteobacteria bacterium]MBP6051196.1 protein translocase subunit SecD [Pseudomonadales bacterium]MBK6581542.1 protein translocase subunit SecD [Gammaproteobacteria bacterium]MBK7522303.1 protein translocase subunit SecD [Gammaproteobacteria bacterium]MBK7728708.1 protein translocase subunit SecD [Gammaproteobacteria bacterium]
MLNRYPLWKNLLVAFVLVLSAIYALPNIYPPDPAVQVSGSSSALEIDQATLDKATDALAAAGIAVRGSEFSARNALLRLDDAEQQLRAKSVIKRALGDDYVVALNLAPTTPDWLLAIGGSALKLGLDLSGGVHFLLQVDTAATVAKRLDIYATDVKKKLREQRIRGLVTVADAGHIELDFASAEVRARAAEAIQEAMPELQRLSLESDGKFRLQLALTEAQIREMEDYAVNQNLTTLRNRVNELGVSEPLIQKQGRNRIVVELPGVLDTAEAKRILGKTANLEFRLEARFDDEGGSGKEEFEFRNPGPGERRAWLERDIIIAGDRVTSAQSNYDENGRPQVNIGLDSQGGTMMNRATRDNIKRRMGVLFIERKSRTIGYEKDADGYETPITEKYEEKKIISLATIQSALGTQFRITGLDSPAEAAELALLLRAGALAAPLDFVEERTVGPSLGADNIALGLRSIQIGSLLVIGFMLLVYRVFGIFAILALGFNVMLLLSLMSMLSATLTLPGMAGIVLTIGMAVDANVLINSRIREELANGLTPHAAIHAGYERAFLTIIDSNLTTLLIAVILYAVGTGPVRGFAVVLSLGILTSMFTAVMGTRVLVNLVYGGRRQIKLSI